MQHIKDLLKVIFKCLINRDLHNHYKKICLAVILGFLGLDSSLGAEFYLFYLSPKILSALANSGLLPASEFPRVYKTCYHITLLHIDPYVFESALCSSESQKKVQELKQRNEELGGEVQERGQRNEELEEKVQELKQRNEELEEKTKQQNKCEFEVNVPKNQPRPSSNNQLLVTIALQSAKEVLE